MKLKIRHSLITPLVLALASASASTLPDGKQIEANMNARNEGIAVERSLKMEMTDRRGKQRTRYTKTFRKYYGEEKRTAIFYLEPKNIKDTAFLTYDYPEADKDDDQWLYLPAMRKVRRISASDRGDYFLGTDFTFEDIKLETRASETDFNRVTTEEDSVDGHHVYKVESTPISVTIGKELGVSRREDYIDSKIWMARKSVRWDTKGNLLKTVHFKDIRQVQGIWTAHILEVENHKTGHSTVFTFSDVVYQDDMNDNLFTQQTIQRGI